MALTIREKVENRRAHKLPATRKRIYERYLAGEEQHGHDLWPEYLKRDEKGDYNWKEIRLFLKERLDHAMDHLSAIESNLANAPDDHLAAVGWFVEVAAYMEHHFGRTVQDMIHNPHDMGGE